MNHSSVKSQTVMVNNIANHNNIKCCYHTPTTVTNNNITNHNIMNHNSVKSQTVMVNILTSQNLELVIQIYIYTNL
jgi:hypothetical protein